MSVQRPVGLLGWLLLILPLTAWVQAEPVDGENERAVRRLVAESGSRNPSRRLEAWSRLAELGSAATHRREDIERNARREAERSFGILLRGNTLDELADLSLDRDELDRRRASALMLIRDEERYFYPYKTPDVTAQRARLFPEVRREVEARVESVRALWESDAGVDVPEEHRAAALEIVWIERVADGLAFEVEWPAVLPRWILGLAETQGRVGLQNFAWSPAQIGRWRYDRAVQEFNERRWGGIQTEGTDSVRPIECEQVRLTNGYRRMMGECVLAWSEKLQRAAHDHSQYMADRSVLTHKTSLPGRETPAGRMRSAGYRFGRAENIYFGPGGALAAHVLWVGSSAHHRALLDPELRGMASAEVNGYWTQSMGSSATFTSDPEFIKALWHD